MSHLTDQLAEQFLTDARKAHPYVEPVRILRARAYQIGQAHVLLRAAIEGRNHRYFFGLNYIHAEEVNNLSNSHFAFICGRIDQTIFIPSNVLIEHLPLLSHDRNGEYKLSFDGDLNLVLSGRNQRLDCSKYLNKWEFLSKTQSENALSGSAEESIHSVVQGRLLEIGNIRGYRTFCPNRSRTFNGKKLQDIASLQSCPKLQYSDHKVLRQIDVLWFRERGSNLIPEYGFEVELSTGTWSGVGRLAVLHDYATARLFIISSEERKYRQVMSAWADYQNRYKHVQVEDVGELYAAELNLRSLRQNIGI